MKAKAMIPALMKVIGTPLKLLRTGVSSSFSRILDMSTIAIVKPIPAARPAKKDWRRLYPESMLMMAIPRTAQLVVMRGR